MSENCMQTGDSAEALARAFARQALKKWAVGAQVHWMSEENECKDNDDSSTSAVGALFAGGFTGSAMPMVVMDDPAQGRMWLVHAVDDAAQEMLDGETQREWKERAQRAGSWAVVVLAMSSRAVLAAVVDAISEETVVWIAEAPEHLVHFGGERLLGPY